MRREDRKFQETLDTVADKSLEVQQVARRAGTAAGIVVGGVVAGAGIAAFRTVCGGVKGLLLGGRIGMGQLVDATEESLVRAKNELRDQTTSHSKREVDEPFCSNCGTVNQEGAKFCSNCGHRQGTSGSQTSLKGIQGVATNGHTPVMSEVE